MDLNSLRFSREIASHAPLRWPDILAEEYDAFLRGDSLQWMRVGRCYYDGDHDVLHRARSAVGEFGRLIDVQNVADNRLTHNFTRELCDQKTQYLLGKPYAIQCDDDAYRQAVEAALGPTFPALLMRLAKDAIRLGIAWLHVYCDESGHFSLRRFPGDEMIPLWRDAEHTRLDAMIRLYDSIEYDGRQSRTVHHAQLFSNAICQDFVQRQGRWVEDGAAMPLLTRYAPHAAPQPVAWHAPPFIPFKYNDEEHPLIRSLKPLIDNYDRVASDNANALEDQPNSILVLRNYDGQRLDEFRRNLAAYRAVKVSDDGGVEALQTPIAHEAVASHLERLRRDIYAFGRGVDTRGEPFGNPASGVALRHQYAQLDMDCNGLEAQMHDAIANLMTFVHRHVAAQNPAYADHAPALHFVFNRDILVNEEAAVQMCRDSTGLISARTIAENHPWVRDASFELASLAPVTHDTVPKKNTFEEVNP